VTPVAHQHPVKAVAGAMMLMGFAAIVACLPMLTGHGYMDYVVHERRGLAFAVLAPLCLLVLAPIGFWNLFEALTWRKPAIAVREGMIVPRMPLVGSIALAGVRDVELRLWHDPLDRSRATAYGINIVMADGRRTWIGTLTYRESAEQIRATLIEAMREAHAQVRPRP
jgi:hypothetical protein